MIVTVPLASLARSALSTLNQPSGRTAITALANTGSFQTEFDAPGAGSLQVDLEDDNLDGQAREAQDRDRGDRDLQRRPRRANGPADGPPDPKRQGTA